MSVEKALVFQGSILAMLALISFLCWDIAGSETSERVVSGLAGVFASISIASFLAAIWIGVQW